MIESGLNRPLCICVLLRDLVWGSEVLHVLSRYVVGTILDGEEGADGAAFVRCDFGVYLDV